MAELNVVSIDKAVKPKEIGKDQPFAVGSTVALKGGGIVMTVRKIAKETVFADWHDKQDTLCTADFPSDMLYNADPEEVE